MKLCSHASRNRYAHSHRHSDGFTLVEVLVTTSLIVALMAILIPVFGKAREAARFTAWHAMSSSMQADPRLALYYTFDGQTGDETNAAGELVVLNKAQGDPMALVASEESQKGAQDPELRYGVLKDPRPDNVNQGFEPTFEPNKGRFRAKTAMKFHGDRGGSYIQPDFWTGIVEKGEFQVAFWSKLQQRQWQRNITWGHWDKDTSERTMFSIAVGAPDHGYRLRTHGDYAGTEGFENEQYRVADDQWHFVVVKLEGDFTERLPKLREVQVSVDGRPFQYANGNGNQNNTPFNVKINRLMIGAKVFGGLDGNDADTVNTGEDDQPTSFTWGMMDEVAIWQEPTSYEEVKRMYKIGAPMGSSPLAPEEFTGF